MANNKSHQQLGFGTIENDKYLLKRINLLTQQVNSLLTANPNGEELIVQNANEAEGQMIIKSVRKVIGPMSGPSWSTFFEFEIPAFSLILGTSINVDVAGAGGSWGADFTGGATGLAVPSGTAATLNTKKRTTFIPQPTASSVTEVEFNTDASNLDDLVVDMVVYYVEITELADV